jgi:hypothetical protein
MHQEKVESICKKSKKKKKNVLPLIKTSVFFLLGLGVVEGLFAGGGGQLGPDCLDLATDQGRLSLKAGRSRCLIQVLRRTQQEPEMSKDNIILGRLVSNMSKPRPNIEKAV